MNTSLETQAELLRLGRVLDVGPNDLTFLEKADAVELRELRASVSDRLLSSHREQFELVVALGRHLPAGVAARLAQRALGPQLSGRAASLLDADRLADLAGRLPPDFLADVAAVLDLRYVGPLIRGVDGGKVVEVTRVLIDREEWTTMAAFVDAIRHEVLVETIRLLAGEALLRVGFVLEDRSRLDEILLLLDDERLREMLIAAEKRDLIAETLHLVNALADPGVARVAAMLAKLSEEHQRALAAKLVTDPDLLAAAQRLIANSPPTVHAAIARARLERV
jgi:hypothetical protein